MGIYLQKMDTPSLYNRAAVIVMDSIDHFVKEHLSPEHRLVSAYAILPATIPRDMREIKPWLRHRNKS